MALVLVVDENDWNREALCSLLHGLGHQTWQARDLSDVRTLLASTAESAPATDGARRELARPALCLVELVRRQGNGFSLASWLQSRGLGKAVLLSDRGEVADGLWARARGIEWMLSRALGAAAFSAQLCRILQVASGDSADV